MGMECTLEVNGSRFDNYNNRNEFVGSMQRREDGAFDSLYVYCIYENGFGEVFLKVYVKEIRKEFCYEINQSDGTNYEFFEYFEFTEKDFGIPNDIQEINFVVRTCWCEKDCYRSCSDEGRLEREELNNSTSCNESTPNREQLIDELCESLEKLII